MLSQRTIESCVGAFLIAAISALVILAFKVSGLTDFLRPAGYIVTAEFDDIGGLKVRSPVKVGGVLIGEVTQISLDPSSYKANVKMRIASAYNEIPDDSSAAIMTSGLLGDNYISLSPMYSQTFLKEGSEITDTHPAIVLEKLIGQLMFKIGNDKKSGNPTTATPASGEKNDDTKKN